VKRAAKSKATSKGATTRRPAVTDGQRIRTLQAALGKAIRGGDKPTVRNLLSPQFVWINQHGTILSRTALLGGLSVAASARADTGVKVRMYGDIALVSGRRKSTGGETLYFTDIWIKGAAGWRALIRHDNILAAADVPDAPHAPQPRLADAKPPDCANPIDFVPYTPKSKAERDIIASFQALEKAVIHNDADEWVKHVAEEFVVTRTRQHTTSKAGRVAVIEKQASVNGETFVAEVEWMNLWVKGDAAVMRADHRMPGNRRPPYLATRIWVKRDGRWLMAMSQQTAIAG
jgi:ketosteroid isomerase-like protein